MNLDHIPTTDGVTTSKQEFVAFCVVSCCFVLGYRTEGETEDSQRKIRPKGSQSRHHPFNSPTSSLEPRGLCVCASTRTGLWASQELFWIDWRHIAYEEHRGDGEDLLEG